MAQKQSPKQSTSKAKRNKGSSRQSFSDDKSNRLMFLGVAIVYVLLVGVCCVKFVVTPGSSRTLEAPSQNIPLSKMTEEQIKQTFSSVDIEIKDKSGRITHKRATLQSIIHPSSTTKENLVVVTHDEVDGISYYHCGGWGTGSLTSDGSVPNGRDLVILDGSSFFRPSHFSVDPAAAATTIQQVDSNHNDHENSILDLCDHGRENDLTSITALNINEAVEPSKLLLVLQTLQSRGKIVSLPLAAIVTPRRSDATIVDWILYGDIQRLPRDVAHHWITVSTEPTDDTSSLQVMGDSWPVLALYGEDDPVGQTAARRLEQHVAGAEARSLPGGADCFVQHPVNFSKAMLEYLDDRLPKQEISRPHVPGPKLLLQMLTE